MSSTGPSIRAVCRILMRNSCGSGSICGILGGHSLIMTNAHVAGSRVGSSAIVEAESTGVRLETRIVMAAYSDRTLADWCLLKTVNPYSDVEPVKLSKDRPSGSHYTKGFPRCRPHGGTNITTVDMSNNSSLWRWNPNAIGGQSGSGVWSDLNNLQYGLLTWSWGGYGAGQMTSEIYKQARQRSVAGAPRPDGLADLIDHDYDWGDIDRSSLPEAQIVEGFSMQAGLADMPIWHEPTTDPDPDPEPSPTAWKQYEIAKNRKLAEFYQDQVDLLEGMGPTTIKPKEDDGNGGLTFGL